MEIVRTQIDGLYVLEPRVFEDHRGFFFESFNGKKFEKEVGSFNFVQDNHSKSNKGVLRGLHYQIQQPQGKLVRVVSGSVFDVAVDLRKSSETFGSWFGIELSASNKKQLWIPAGFAHGFLTLENNTEFLYKTTDFYFPEHERSILWNDNVLNILWPQIEPITVSEKDQLGFSFSQAEVYTDL
jgi:dTDP-4-dehydrorhamnose 3,5-epimerase